VSGLTCLLPSYIYWENPVRKGVLPNQYTSNYIFTHNSSQASYQVVFQLCLYKHHENTAHNIQKIKITMFLPLDPNRCACKGGPLTTTCVAATCGHCRNFFIVQPPPFLLLSLIIPHVDLAIDRTVLRCYACDAKGVFDPAQEERNIGPTDQGLERRKLDSEFQSLHLQKSQLDYECHVLANRMEAWGKLWAIWGNEFYKGMEFGNVPEKQAAELL
jgi:hypothetical protein